MRIPQPLWRSARRQVVHRLVGQARHLHIQQSHIDMLPTTIVITVGQRRQNRHGRIQPRQDIRERHTHLHRPRTLITFGPPGQAHQTAEPLDHEVITRTLRIRSGLTETGDRAIDQIRIDRLQRLVIQAIGRQTTTLKFSIRMSDLAASSRTNF